MKELRRSLVALLDRQMHRRPHSSEAESSGSRRYEPEACRHRQPLLTDIQERHRRCYSTVGSQAVVAGMHSGRRMRGIRLVAEADSLVAGDTQHRPMVRSESHRVAHLTGMGSSVRCWSLAESDTGCCCMGYCYRQTIQVSKVEILSLWIRFTCSKNIYAIRWVCGWHLSRVTFWWRKKV